MSLLDRLRKAEAAVSGRPVPGEGWVTLLVCTPAGHDPDNRPPGFYPPEHPHATVADLVYAGDQPDIPHKLLTPNCLVVTCDPRPDPGPSAHPGAGPG